MFDTPILFIIFNRPDTTKLVFEQIRNIQPKQLFIAADGPRITKKGEFEICQETRDFVLSSIDWDCDISTLFREQNLGCGYSVSNAISWFFKNVKSGIILEDDCVPNHSFFIFCQHMLEKYKDREDVFHITGTWYLKEEKYNHVFSKHPFIWGWATWQRAWEKFDLKLHGDSLEEIETIILKNLKSKYQTTFWINNFSHLINQGWGFTWDYQWIYTIWKYNGITISPTKNLVSNIGFNDNATHTSYLNPFLANFPTKEYSLFRIEYIGEINKKREKQIFDYFFQSSSRLKFSLKKKIKLILRRIFPSKMKKKIRSYAFGLFKLFLPEISILKREVNWDLILNYESKVIRGENVQIYGPYHITETKIGDFTYIAQNSYISKSSIGKFCSIGPNFMCGWGIHATDGLSTAPMFYSTLKQNGISLCQHNKIVERKNIEIGNDVFIGANVTILDGIKIGDGVIIGAGAVVSKNIPPYAVAVGVPIKIIRYRFNEDQISKLLRIRWWNFDEVKLKDVENMFFEIDRFIEKYE